MIVRHYNKNRPKILYKYRFFDIDGYHIDSLVNNSIWFTSANKFNDPFDCSIIYQFDGNKRLRRRCADHFLRREYPNLTNQQREKFIESKIKKIDNDPKYLREMIEYLINANYNQFGICCFTPYYDNLLMWAHYSNNHEGFCVGIKLSKIRELQTELSKRNELLELFKIKYSKKMPLINFYRAMLSQEENDSLTPLITTKSNHWRYENEFRLIYWYHPNTLLTLLDESIAEIILGHYIKAENANKIVNIIKDKKMQISVFQAQKEERKFALKFVQIL